jgi:hypothetical protein
MGQFKPMVKMMTTEPSVILKLKKGGKVASKAMDKSDGFKSMVSNNAKVFEDAENGVAPKKPSMAARRKAMNPNMYAKGGKVAHKQMGGMMPTAPGAMPGATAPAPMPMRAMGRTALAGMPPAKRNARAMAVRRALTGMKDGGSAECKALEKELKHHESMSASKAHGKASGGIIMSKTGKTKMDTAKKGVTTGSTGEVKEGKPGGYAKGGNVGVKMGNAGGFKMGGKVPGLTGATVEGGNWENRPANTSKPGVSGTTTGGVKKANGGGYKMGGSTKKAYATGGTVDTGKPVAMPKKPVSRPIANSLQSGTFKKGGKVEKEEKPNLRLLKTHSGPKGHVAKVYKDKDWGEHRVKFFSPEGKHYSEADYHTDDLSDAHDTATGQLNRYKMGGKVAMNASGGSQKNEYDPNDFYDESEDSDGRIRTRVKSTNPRYSETAVNKAISSSNRSGRKIGGKEAKAIHSLLKGRYAKGGEVGKFNDGGSSNDKYVVKDPKAVSDKASRELEEAMNPLSMAKELYGKAKNFFSPSAGSVTKTEKSVTVSPGKKRGGSAKC